MTFAVAARSSPSRSRSIPISPASGSLGAFVNTASLPIVTPCSFVPISAPQIQNGWLSSVACVSSTSGISIHVHFSPPPGAFRPRPFQTRFCPSFAFRSEFFANRTRPPATIAMGSHMVPLSMR